MICYRNLRCRVCSIAEVSGNDRIGSVIAHERSVSLANAGFVIKEPARQCVIRSRAARDLWGEAVPMV